MASWSESGDVIRGQTGVFRCTTSAQVTRSCVRSMPGGTEVSDAAAKKIEMPMPNSTSANRFMRSTDVPGLPRSRSVVTKLPRPNSSKAANIATFAITITPYAVPYAADQEPM